MSKLTKPYLLTFFIPYIIFLIVGFIFYLKNGNAAFLFWVNGGHTNFLDVIFKYITHLGDGIFFAVLAVVLLIKNRKIGLVFAFLGLLQAVVSSLFKRILFPESLRPKGVFGVEFVNLVEGVNVHAHHSFPSGHTITAFSIATFFTFYFKNNKLSWIFLALAVLAGISRVYLFQHFLIDILVGSLVGTLLAIIATQFFKATRL